MMTRHATLSLALALILLGCSSAGTGYAERAQTELIGMRRTGLVSCAGSPSETKQENGAEILFYRASLDRTVAIDTLRTAGSPTPSDSMQTYSRYCEARFTLVNGTVTAITMSGRSGAGREDQSVCGTVLQRCLR